MDTLDNAYVSALRARVVEVGPGFVLLDRSIFYPEGGGQPSDRGTLTLVDPATQATRQVEVTPIDKPPAMPHLVTATLAGIPPPLDPPAHPDRALLYAYTHH